MSNENTISVVEVQNSVKVTEVPNKVTVTKAHPLVSVSAPYVRSGEGLQNVFGTVTDGTNTAVADSTNDTLTFTGTAPVTTTVNASGDSVTVAVANATTSAHGLMSSSDKTKVDGIATGAEVNVQSDWNASSGDANILNKPTIPSALVDLSNVSYSGTPTTNHVLKWTGSVWEPQEDASSVGEGEANVQADWNQSTSSHDAFIQNKPTIPSGNQIIDWTSASAGTIHATNYTDTNTTYSVQDGGLSENNFTDADHTKLNGIEASATADQTDAEIRSAVESATDSNVFTDADHTKLNGIATSANNYTLPNATASVKGGVIVNTGSGLNISSGTISLGSHNHTNAGWANAGFMSSTDKNKLDAIEASATADQTDAEIRSAVESASDSNVFTDADHTKLNGIETSATADQTGAQIKTAYEAESDTNAYTDAEKTKLSGIATSAEVNVQADWNQSTSSHDAYIANKPTIPSGNQIIDWTSASAGTIHASNYSSSGGVTEDDVIALSLALG